MVCTGNGYRSGYAPVLYPFFGFATYLSSAANKFYPISDLNKAEGDCNEEAEIDPP
jgi:hypothetical protein